MKNISILFASLAAILCLAACNKEQDIATEDPQGEEFATITFTAEKAGGDTKTAINVEGTSSVSYLWTDEDLDNIKLYEVTKNGMLLYQSKEYTFDGGKDASKLIGMWRSGNSLFEFTEKGTFDEDGYFFGHYLIDEEAGTIKLMYEAPLEDTILYYNLDGEKLTIDYPWPMVLKGEGTQTN